MIRDQEETDEQQGAQPPEGERAREVLPCSDGSHASDEHRCEDDEAHIDRVSGDEPLLPARVHRPSDLVRLFLGILGLALVLALAAFAHSTTAGLEKDIGDSTGKAPQLLADFAGLTANIAVFIVPVAFAMERLIKRDGLRIADGVLAAVLAHGVSLATDLWVARAAPETISDALTRAAPSGGVTDPVHGYLAPVIAYMTAVGMSRRPRWRVAMWAVLLLDAFAVLVGGYTTPFSIAVTVLIGWTVAYGTLYAVGSPNVRPTGQNLLAGLRRVGFKPVTALRSEDVPDGEHASHHDRGRRYIVTLEDGPPLDVTVVDREQQAQGFFYRVWQRLALRGFTQRRSLQSLRQALEQEALLAYAAIAAGANAPKLIATSELGPDAVMLVYEHIGGRTLDALPDEEITDELLAGAWKQLKFLQSRRIAHRRLDGDALLVDRSGNVVLTDLSGGEIAAGDLVLRMDIAQLLTTLGLRVGAERSVAAAVDMLGPDAIADSLPLLQPLALTRISRATLRQLARERSQREREAVLEASHARKAAKEAKAAEEAEEAEEKARAAEAAEAVAAGETEGAARAVEEAGAAGADQVTGSVEAADEARSGATAGSAQTVSMAKTGGGATASSAVKAGNGTGNGTRTGSGADGDAEAGGGSDRKAARAERQAEKRALDEAAEDAREEDLLSQIRQQVLLIRPQAAIEPVRLERIKPRTLFTFMAGTLAAYFLLSQLTNTPIGDIVSNANWVWVAVAVFFSALTQVAAALSLLGFVPEKVSFRRTVVAQVASSFVKLVAPAAVGGVALNTRFLQRAGVRPGLAVASVGASQLFGMVCHILLLLSFGYVTGTERASSLSPSRTVIGGLLTAAVLVLVVTAVPFLRKFVVTRVRSLFAGVVPRMLDVLQRPQKLATGIGGMLLLTAANVMCLDAATRAFGGDLSYASTAVVFLTANAIGSAAPTPGGVGAVEIALTSALTLAGMPADAALSAVLVFRLMVFWLPVIPGWISFTYLTRKGAI